MRYLSSKLVKNLYVNILKRNPTDTEILHFQLDQLKNPNLPHRISAMINSKEFEIMLLPELVRKASEEYVDRKLFFLHIPKTAGSSIRLALVEALGIPSFNLYPLSTHQSPSNSRSMNFWPYWAGHANISIFPDSHSGFTVFRETMSRILSKFRQDQYNMEGENPHLLIAQNSRSKMKEPLKNEINDFNQWIKKQPRSIMHYFVPDPEKKVRSLTWVAKVANLSEIELLKSLKVNMKRFESAAWIHQPEDVLEGIRKITGKSDIAIPRENEFKKTSIYKEEVISPESMEIMKEAAKLDNLVFRMALDLGILIKDLDVDREEIFESSLKRLGFRLK